MQTIFHADDFGINVDQSLLILSCSEGCGGTGPLNSTSMLVGSPAAAECAELIRPFVAAKRIRIGLHLNLVEGPCCANPNDIGLLVDDRGMFCNSFASLLFKTSAPGSAELNNQIRIEVDAQLKKFLTLFPDEACSLRVDSHQHFHLIPAVFKALLGSIKDNGCLLEFMRIPAEPRGPYHIDDEVKKQCPPINLVKNLLLNHLWQQDAPTVKEYFHMTPDEFISSKSATFYGLMLSGRMEHSARLEVVKAFEDEAVRNNSAAEILFHPGGCPDAQSCLDPELKDFVSFYVSEHRELERKALIALDFRPYCPIEPPMSAPLS